jgi:hypothetical protein
MRSKVVIACGIIWFSAIAVSAQNKDKRYHNFGSERNWKIQVYAGPYAAVSSVEGILAVDLGATGGFIYKKKFIAGLYGQKMVTDHIRSNLSISDYPASTEGEIKMMHVGGLAGYIFKPEALVHWGVSSSAGVGKLDLLVLDPATMDIEKTYSDRIFIVIPRLFAEMNITKWFKINVTGGYRFPGKVNSYYTNQSGEEIPVFNNADYTKPEFSVSLLVGPYGFRTATLF